MWTQSSDRRTDRQTDREADRITITKTVQHTASHGNYRKYIVHHTQSIKQGKESASDLLHTGMSQLIPKWMNLNDLEWSFCVKIWFMLGIQWAGVLAL